MSRFTLFILALHLPFYMHTADTSNSNPFDFDDLFTDIESDSSASDDPYENHVDISGIKSYATVLGISTAPSDRSFTGAALRSIAKYSGALHPDMAGIGSLEERKRTEAIFNTFDDMLHPKNELDQETSKRFMDRQFAAMAMGISLLKSLQSSNSGTIVPDIFIKIQAAQQLLQINENAALPPNLTNQLKIALISAKTKIASQIQEQPKSEV